MLNYTAPGTGSLGVIPATADGRNDTFNQNYAPRAVNVDVAGVYHLRFIDDTEDTFYLAAGVNPYRVIGVFDADPAPPGTVKGVA